MKKHFVLLILLLNTAALVAGETPATTSSTDSSLNAQESIRQLVLSARNAKPSDRKALLEKIANPDLATKVAVEPSYLQLLDDRDADIRSAAAHACGILKTVQSIPKIRALLKSVPKHGLLAEELSPQLLFDEYAQSFAFAQALSDLNDRESINDISRRDALAPAWELIMPKFGAAAIPALAERARTSRINSQQVRLSAMRAIAAVSDENAAPALKLLLSDSDPNVRKGAARALGKMNVPGAAEAVEKIYDSLSDWDKIYFVQGGAKKRDISITLKYSKAAIDDPKINGATKSEFVIAIAMTGSPTVIPYLEDLLKNKDESVRAQAECQLAGMTGKIYPYEETNGTRYLNRGCSYLDNHLIPNSHK